MTPAEQAIREALAAGPTPGPWSSFYKSKYDEWHVSIPVADSSMKWALFDDGIRTERPEADARYIAAVNPAAISSLLAEMDAMRKELSDTKELLRVAVTRSKKPGSFYIDAAMNKD